MPTINTNFLPASTGLALGNVNQKWDAVLQNISADSVDTDLVPQAAGQTLGSPAFPWNADLASVSVTGDVLPTTNGAQNLGSVTERWNAFLGSASFTSGSSALFNNVVYVDGVIYPYTNAGIQAAINAACNGTIPGKVIIGPVAAGTAISIATTITVPSNCWIDGSGAKNITFQAANTLAAEIFEVSGSVNVFLSNFGIDGGRISNAIFGLGIYGCSNVYVESLSIGNCYNNGILISNGGSFIRINGCDVFNSGLPLPSAGGSGIAVGSGVSSANISHVSLTNNMVHGNNIGIQILPTSVSTSVIEGLEISGNKVYSNCNDGITMFSSAATYGTIVAPRVISNESFSNGWPANGTGFSTNTPAGLLQTGSSASSSGCGIDILATFGLITNPIISDNYCHDNVFDGVAFDGSLKAIVNTSGTAVTATSGVFSLDWKGQYVRIGGTYYPVASVADTTHLTLTTSAGSLTANTLIGPTKIFGVVSGNQSNRNGVGAVGTGFFQTFCAYNTFSNNIAEGNNQEGYGVDGCYAVSFTGDRAFGNNTSGNAGHKFGFALKQGCANVSLRDVCTDDFTTSPTQTVGVGVAQTSANVCLNTIIESAAVFGTNTVLDSGTNTSYRDAGGSASLTGQTAAIAATTLYTPTLSGMYRISAYLKVTTTGTSPVIGPVTITYTDGGDSVAQSVIMSMQTQAGVAQATGNNGNSTTSLLAGDLVIWAKIGVAVQYAIALTGTVGAAVYEAQLKCRSV